MKTLVAVVSFGRRDRLTDVSFRRAFQWASRQGYSIVLIKEPLQGTGKSAHYGKLRVHQAFPGFERYCIIDDDLLISSRAPELPEIPRDKIGLAPDAEQRNTKNPSVKWTGNTGFILAPSSALDLLDRAFTRGDDETVWGIADQGALNSVAWAESRVHPLDPRWNFQPILEFFIKGQGWDRWKTSLAYRLSFYTGVAARWPHPVLNQVRKCHGLHMIRGGYPGFFDRVLPKF